jgi:hypothetical protein
VTPHIGFTGRLYGVTSAEYEAFSSPLPAYNYCTEAQATVQATKNVATSDHDKMEVELYDNKFTSLLPIQIKWSLALGFSLFEFWYYDMVLVTTMYDATLLVWRDKVLFNMVRPPTVIHALYRNASLLTYGGPYQGVQTIQGRDWQAYIRTMSHA